MRQFSLWKTLLIWFAIVAAALAAAPNLFSPNTLASLPQWLPHKALTPGLDLRGGAYLVVKIDRADIVQSRLESTVASVRTRLRDANIRYTGLAGNAQTVPKKTV